MEEKEEVVTLSKTTLAVVLCSLILGFLGMYLVVTYLPYWMFVIIHTFVGLTASYVMYRKGERNWFIILLLYTVVMLAVSVLVLVRIYGFRLTLLFVSPEDVWGYIQIAAQAAAYTFFAATIPIYVIGFAVLGFAFVWSLITRQPQMFKVMKMISMILVIVGIIVMFLSISSSTLTILTGAGNILVIYYAVTIVGTFLSAYSFVLSFMGGMIESIGAG